MIGRTLTLRRAIVLVVVFGLLVPGMMFGGYTWFAAYDREVRQRTQELLEQNADVLANGMQEPLWNINTESGLALLNAMMARNEDIVKIEVRDTALGVFVYDERPQRRVGFTLTTEKPVTYRGTAIGTVKIEVGSERLRRTLIDSLVRQMIALAAQVVLSIVLILILLEKRLVGPLHRLGKGAERLAGRELDTPFTWNRLDEIGLLGQRLEATRISLRSLFQDLDQKNRQLELDIEKRKRAEDALRSSERRFSAIFNSSPVAMYLIQFYDDYTVKDINAAFERLFMRDRQEVIGKRTEQIGMFLDNESRRAVTRTLASEGSLQRLEIWMVRGDGNNVLVQISAHLLELEGKEYAIVACEDVTDKRRIENEILELNANLENRVIERTNELQLANKELASTLETLNMAQGELVRSEKLAALGSLVAGIAHELNTPIGNSLMVASSLIDQTREINKAYNENKGLKRSTLEGFFADSAKAGDILVRNLYRAANLVTSFKHVAVDQTSSQRRKFSLAEVISEIILTMSPTLRKTAFVVEHNIPPDMMLDSYPGPLGQVIGNLINNALLHGFEGRSTGTVTILAKPTQPGWLELFVIDNGIGIPAANLNRIFDPFFTTKLGAGGSGMGLNITHNIVVDVLGGRIGVDSEIGHGTTFTLTLPMVAPEIQEDDHHLGGNRK